MNWFKTLFGLNRRKIKDGDYRVFEQNKNVFVLQSFRNNDGYIRWRDEQSFSTLEKAIEALNTKQFLAQQIADAETHRLAEYNNVYYPPDYVKEKW